jgi:type VI secretion system protein ImpG
VFGAVLNRYFSRHASINTLTELVLSTSQRGEVAKWTAQPGARAVI